MKIFKNGENNIFLTTLLCMLIMLVSISILTTLILFAARTAENDSVPAVKDVNTTQNGKDKPSTTDPSLTATQNTTTIPDTTTADDDPVIDPTPRKRVAVTFDDGPNTTLTYKFVDKLKEYGAAATFFVVGNRMGQNNGAALQYAVDNGCEVGIHSYAHDYYNKMTMDEYLLDLQKTVDAVNKYVDTKIRLMRPPGGILSTAQKEACPYTAIMWSVDSNDWKHTVRSEEKKEQNVQAIVNNVMSVIREGDIVLMHELYENSYDAFCIIIDQLYEQGYEIVTVSELLGEENVVPGVAYYNGR